MDLNSWSNTIDTISQRFGNIPGISSAENNETVKRKKKNNVSCTTVFKGKEKSASEEPMGIEGLRKKEEKRGREAFTSFSPTTINVERRSVRLRFKSPSDNAHCSERHDLHQTALVRHNQNFLRSHLRIPCSLSAVGLSTMEEVITTVNAKIMECEPTISTEAENQEVQPNQTEVTKKKLKRRARSD